MCSKGYWNVFNIIFKLSQYECAIMAMTKKIIAIIFKIKKLKNLLHNCKKCINKFVKINLLY